MSRQAWLLVLACLGCTEQYEVFPLAGRDAGVADAAGSAGADTGGVGGAPSPTGATLGAMDVNACSLEGGVAWCWGSNADYALGLSDTTVSAPPTAVSGVTDLVVIGVGLGFACGLGVEGEVWCWGRNASGQLGTGDTTSRPEPQPVLLEAGATQISVGTEHACAITPGGELWCWGENGERQLGNPDLDADQTRPLRVGTWNDWAEVSAGQGHTCGIRVGGSLYCWGRNAQGQLGLGANAPIQLGEPTLVNDTADWTQVAADQRITCGIQAPGALYCWGDNTDGQLGVGDLDARLVPERIGTGSDWRKVAVNALHSCALDGAGTVWCWGRGAEGQLGLGDAEPRLEPTTVEATGSFVDLTLGRFFTCVREEQGAVFCTGRNDDGALGIPNVDRVLELTAVEGLP